MSSFASHYTATDNAHTLSRPAPPVHARIPAIDLLRGLVIVLMALDHTRDFFSAMALSASDLATTTPALFLTRWVTHLCAPTFFLLAGLSAYLLRSRTNGDGLARHLALRGLLLIALEWTVVTFLWMFNLRYPLGLILQVLWALGVSMLILAALTRVPVRILGAIGTVLIVAHNLTDGLSPEAFGAWAPLWQVLHVRGPLAIGAMPIGFVHYPLLPWIGVMLLGHALGTVYTFEADRRRRWLSALGVGFLLAFAGLRLLNGYGDPNPWAVQPTVAFTLLSFLNTTKYPPSLAYLLMTLGPALLLLAALEHRHAARMRMLAVFGAVPLFAYVAHLGIVHLFAGIFALATGHGTVVLTNMFLFYPKTWGIGLPAVYLAWLVVLATLFPLCLWFASIQRKRDWPLLRFL
jgi:uncharacterized membrane protein